jgi:hypothetical protein
MRRDALLGLSLSLGMLVLAGCGDAAADLPLAPPAILAATQIPPLEVPVLQGASATVDDSTQIDVPPPIETASPPQVEPAVTEPIAPAPPTPDPQAYEPPFPDRTDLFVPPKRVGGAPTDRGPAETSVELLGFVRVDLIKAVLSINGEVAPMAAGESRYGVDVISINPPNVLLQRGRQRWQATLE